MRGTVAVPSILLIFQVGCGMGPFNVSGPIVEDKLGKFRTLAITGERRVIMFNEDTNKYCAEPPPDVAQNISSVLRFAADASGGKLPGDLGADFSRAMAVTAQRLMNRSQGLQLYRDGMYYLCQGFLNGIVGQPEFKEQSESLLKSVRELVIHEITESKGGINAPPNASNPTVPEVPAAGTRPLRPQ